jgi:hypothetical protein
MRTGSQKDICAIHAGAGGEADLSNEGDSACLAMVPGAKGRAKRQDGRFQSVAMTLGVSLVYGFLTCMSVLAYRLPYLGILALNSGSRCFALYERGCYIALYSALRGKPLRLFEVLFEVVLAFLYREK